MKFKISKPSAYKHCAYIALGSNLAGDLDSPASQVKRGFERINQIRTSQLIKASSLYLSAPFGYQNQPDFVNAVCKISTNLSPLDLLNALFAIENSAGRQRTFANAPRQLDCDLLLYDDLKIHTEKLTLPHPRMYERAFVLMPLAEIAPRLLLTFKLTDLTLPFGGNVVKLAEAVKNQGISKLA